jgi:hypothetical protein
MRISRVAIVSCVLLFSLIYATGVETAEPVWKERQTVSVIFKIKEGDQVLSVPTIRCLSNSGQEAKISVGAQALVGHREEVGEQIVGYEASVIVNSVDDERFRITYSLDFNEVQGVKPELLFFAKQAWQSSLVVGKGKEYVIGGSGPTKEDLTTRATMTLTRIEPAGWVNLTPVSVAGRSLSAESILQTICKQGGLKLDVDRLDAKTKEKIQRKTIVSLTNVPFDRALRALGEHCGFSAFYFKDEGKCYVQIPKHLKK